MLRNTISNSLWISVIHGALSMLHCRSMVRMLGLHAIGYCGDTICYLGVHHCHGGSLHGMRLWLSLRMNPWWGRKHLLLLSCSGSSIAIGGTSRLRSHTCCYPCRLTLRILLHTRGTRQRMLEITGMSMPPHIRRRRMRRSNTLWMMSHAMHSHSRMSGGGHPRSSRSRCKVWIHHVVRLLVRSSVSRGYLGYGVLGDHHWDHHHDLWRYHE